MTEHEHSNQFLANNQQELEPAIVEDELAEIRLYDERKIGELIPTIITVGTKSHDTTLSDLNIKKDQSSRWQQLPKIPEPQFNEEMFDIEQNKMDH